jgi:uncharacterized membrane protein YozB (DUF420 family)
MNGEKSMDFDWIPTFSKSLNTAVLLLLGVGLYLRRQPQRHIPIMLTSFGLDVANVLLIEVFARSRGKGAVEQGIDSMSGAGSGIERFHIIVSIICILLYVVAVWSGLRLRRRGVGRKFHRVNAGFFLTTRLASYVTSFWMGGG